MLKGTTASGFEYCIADEALDDYELLESLNGMTKGNLAEITDVVDRLLGEEAKTELKEHLRGKNGRVKSSDMMAEVLEIIKESKEGKKLLILADMIRTDEDALICDLAETYHIFDYRAELPCKKVALLAVGLRSTSRIKTKLAGFEQPFDIVLLASCLDRLKELVWFNTEDGQKGKNRPDSIADKFIIKDEPTEQGCSIEEFESWRKNLTEG